MSTQKEIKEQDKTRVNPISEPYTEEAQGLKEEEKRLCEERTRLCKERTRLENKEKALNEEMKRLKEDEKRFKKDEKRLNKAKKRKNRKDHEKRFLEKEEVEARRMRDKIKKENPGYHFTVVNKAAELKSNSFWPKWIKVIGNILFGLSIVAAFVETWYFSLLDLLPKFGDSSTIELFFSCSIDILELYLLSALNSRIFALLIMLPLFIMARREYQNNLEKWCQIHPNDDRLNDLVSYYNGSRKTIIVNFFRSNNLKDFCWECWL